MLIGVIASVNKKKKKGTQEETITIVNLGDEYKEQKERLSLILDADEESKQSKKARKLARKAERNKKKAEAKAEAKSETSEKDEKVGKQRLFVLEFTGSSRAQEVDTLRKEITALLSLTREGDEVLLKLESPGGVVDGYGLGASQLQRIRDHGIYLTVAVDKVAASGGYLMACVANHIAAAAFSEIGSIGVVTQIPNVHRFLKNHDIDVDVLTAGKYKRTMTMFGENTPEGKEKMLEDLASVHELFKAQVSAHRPQIDIEHIATGEYWYGTKALQLHLIDEIATSDELICKALETKDVYAISTEKEKSLVEKIGLQVETTVRNVFMNLLHARA